MSSMLIALLSLFAVILLWLDSARAHELGAAVADEICRRRGYQLLDETIALSRFGVTATGHGLRFKRLYTFDYSAEGIGRQQGHLLMHGSRVVNINLNEPEQPTDCGTADPSDAATQEKGDDNVIPFRKRH